MVIDAHAHIFTDDMVKNKDKYCDDRQFSLLYYGKAKIANGTMLLDSMAANRVDASVVLGFTWQKLHYAQMHNEYLARVQNANKGKVYSFGAIALESDIYTQIKSIRQLGLYGIGEVAFYADGFNDDEEMLLASILGIAEKFELPVCLHVNEPIGHVYTGKYYTDIRRLYAILTQYTRIPIICSHWGGGLLFYELMPEVKQSLKHVFYDTAATPFLYSPEIYRIALEICGEEKIIFGSDFPLLDYSRYKDYVQKLNGYTDSVLYTTIQKILGL